MRDNILIFLWNTCNVWVLIVNDSIRRTDTWIFCQKWIYANRLKSLNLFKCPTASTFRTSFSHVFHWFQLLYILLKKQVTVSFQKLSDLFSHFSLLKRNPFWQLHSRRRDWGSHCLPTERIWDEHNWGVGWHLVSHNFDQNRGDQNFDQNQELKFWSELGVKIFIRIGAQWNFHFETHLKPEAIALGMSM